jgi:uncharacterized protein YecE (DUF72 family)
MELSYIGTAGWSIPKTHASRFSGPGTHLERYARRLHAVEVNSSFYRDHQEATYYRWSYTTPPEFRFSVKFPRRYTHEGKLECSPEEMRATLEPIFGLKEKLGVILVQLPPKLAFEEEKADSFFSTLRKEYEGQLACEPRHPSWGEAEALPLFERWRVSKVSADPEPCPAKDDAFLEAGGFRYFRLHGSPEVYRSPYKESSLRELAPRVKPAGTWCIFDNTTFGHATANALELQEMLAEINHQVA